MELYAYKSLKMHITTPKTNR